MFALRRALVGILALASWSCGGSTQPDATPQVADIVVNPASSTLALNAQLPLQALVRNEAGELVPDATVTWTVENPTVASVSAAGVVTGLALGTTQVAASARGKSGVATVNVQRTPVASVVVRPNRVDAAIGSSTQLTATALDASQNTLADRGMVWTTSNAGVATVSTTGLVKAVAAGTATITATSEGKSDAATFSIAAGHVVRVDVTPASANMVAGQTQQLAASPKDAAGTVLGGKTVIWASSNSAVATVSSSGVVTAVAGGSATITATIDGISGSSAITVADAPVRSVAISPSTPSVMVGEKVQLSATVTDVNGQVVTNRPVTWVSDNTAIATVSNSGQVTGVAVGSAKITATSGGVPGSVQVTVLPLPPASVSVSPASQSIVQNNGTTLTATVKDANGGTLSNQPITWTTSDANVASLSATSGQSVTVTGGVAGTATITATSGGKSGTSTITVTPGSVASVSLSLGSTSIKKQTTTTATAIVLDSQGRRLQGVTVTWTASGGATIAPASSVTSVGANSAATATVTAKNVSSNQTAVITVAISGKQDSVVIAVTP